MLTSAPSHKTTDAQRYARHLSLPEVGPAGQARLQAARVLVVGAGGLGCPALLYLSAAGIGRIGIIDGDQVELSNLQRQIIFTEADLGGNKAQAAVMHLSARNSSLQFDCHPQHLTTENAATICKDYQIVVDCTDDISTRLLINDTCLQLQIPMVYASIHQFEGQSALFCTPSGPCYRCLYEMTAKHNQIPSCNDAGVLGAVAGILGAIQAAETIKWLLHIGTPLSARLLSLNALTCEIHHYQLNRNPHCQHHKSAIMQLDPQKDTPQSAITEITPSDLEPLLQQKAVFLLDVREPHEYQQRNLNGHLIPLCELRERLSEIPLDKPIVVHCKSGLRSMRAAQMLIDAGFKDVKNLSGGILACNFY